LGHNAGAALRALREIQDILHAATNQTRPVERETARMTQSQVGQVLNIDAPARILFMGTPDFAVPSLRALVEASAADTLWPGGATIVGVVTREDKPAGRGRQLAHSPVKQAANAAGLAVYQPRSLRVPEAYDQLASLTPNLVVVAAYGQILPTNVLQLPAHGCLNVHASLLPRWRGASPIAAAIRAGDPETGVSIMLMNEGLDTGAVVSARSTPVEPDETTDILTARLAQLGADLLLSAILGWLAGRLTPIPQDERQATMTRPLRKSEGRIDWTRPADELARLIRAMTPWPSAFTTWNGKTLKIIEAIALKSADAARYAPGTCFRLEPSAAAGPLACACGSGALALRVIQLEGKRAQTSAETLRGYPDLASATLGATAE
jgi:methionyl-tRNA formyltransferase